VTEWCCSLIVAYTKWLFQPLFVICHAWFRVNIILSKQKFQTKQINILFIKIRTLYVDLVWKGCFIERLFWNALKCASTVLECSCCKIHRYVAAPIYHLTLISGMGLISSRQFFKGFLVNDSTCQNKQLQVWVWVVKSVPVSIVLFSLFCPSVNNIIEQVN